MPRVQLYDEPLPYKRGWRPLVERAPALVVEEGDTPPPLRADTGPVDAIFATAVLSPTRLLAVCYWARSVYTGPPLVLLDFEVSPLAGDSWAKVQDRLREFAVERRVRSGGALGVFVESDIIATQINVSGGSASIIPPWLTAPNAWHTVCQSAAGLLASGIVAKTQLAEARMQARPFLDAAGIAAGPRGDDPAAPAFLFGLVLALDEAAARDPKQKAIKRANRN